MNIVVARRHRSLATVKEYNEEIEYIHLNPLKAGLVSDPRTGDGPT